ncbi:flagellar motor stator protein MotA [Ectobacillus polymachus]|uniref:flagellar motor stator protein MotA n=1 Tax=Ectobacillus polymachus TaxID=1508806 RepID=UPI003A8AE513
MTSFFGILLAVVVIGLGMVLKGASLNALNNPAAFLIIIGGTAAAIIIAFPFKEIKKFPLLIRVALFTPKQPTIMEQIEELVHCAEVAKKEGFLALEGEIESIKDPFVQGGLELIVDGYNAEFIEEVLTEELDAMESRHKVGALIFTQAGTYAPTLGVLGAVVGLIAALGNLTDINKIGHSISAAFVATLLGIFTGYVCWHPLANKLKRISKLEIDRKLMIIEGVVEIQGGISAKALEKKLLANVPRKERERKKAQAINNE